MNAAEVCSEQFIEVDAWFTIHGCYIDGSATAILDEYIQEADSTIVDIQNHEIPIVLINGVEVSHLGNIRAQICLFFVS